MRPKGRMKRKQRQEQYITKDERIGFPSELEKEGTNKASDFHKGKMYRA
jgi:hypothetical protein